MIDGNRLRNARLQGGLSQRRLAAAAGTDALTILRLEDGADGGELPLRVVVRMAAALGVPPADLLPGGDENCVAEVTHQIGAALLEHRSLSRTDLSAIGNLPVEDLDSALITLAGRLHGTGMVLAHRADTVALLPAVTSAPAELVGRPLNLHQARLLRRIHRGEDVRRKLSRTQRELTLPSLLRAGLVHPDTAGLAVAEDVASSLDQPRHAAAEQ